MPESTPLVTDLQGAFNAQLNAQITAYKKDPRLLVGEELMWFLTWNAFALEDEIHEAMSETGWKPWATSKHINTDAFHGELVDAFHFFMNLCLASGLTAEELFHLYNKKLMKNIARQREGYDGLNKCPKCRRALDDAATTCNYNADSGRGFCQEVGAFSA